MGLFVSSRKGHVRHESLRLVSPRHESWTDRPGRDGVGRHQGRWSEVGWDCPRDTDGRGGVRPVLVRPFTGGTRDGSLLESSHHTTPVGVDHPGRTLCTDFRGPSTRPSLHPGSGGEVDPE